MIDMAVVSHEEISHNNIRLPSACGLVQLNGRTATMSTVTLVTASALRRLLLPCGWEEAQFLLAGQS